MTRLLLLMLALAFTSVATAALATTEKPLLARIIDDSTDRLPQHTVAPEYPRKARRDRIEGEVQVCFDISRSGKPRRIAVRQSSHRWFERVSIKAVRASRYKPLEDDEELQAPKTCRTFVFALEPAE